MARIDRLDIHTIENEDRKIEHNAKVLDKPASDIVNKYTTELDNTINEIKSLLKEGNLSTEDLEYYALMISTQLYYVGQSQEFIGLRADAAKANYKDKFASNFESTTGTIKDKEQYAESKTLYEYVCLSINERAYKRIKQKVENANEVLTSIKKIISRRIAEFELSKIKTVDLIANQKRENNEKYIQRDRLQRTNTERGPR